MFINKIRLYAGKFSTLTNICVAIYIYIYYWISKNKIFAIVFQRPNVLHINYYGLCDVMV